MCFCRFDPIVEMCQTLVPDGFIYLRAQPDTCMNRMMKRSRNEETGVGIEYLQDLHQRHEDWLCSELKKGDDKYRLSRVRLCDGKRKLYCIVAPPIATHTHTYTFYPLHTQRPCSQAQFASDNPVGNSVTSVLVKIWAC